MTNEERNNLIMSKLSIYLNDYSDYINETMINNIKNEFGLDIFFTRQEFINYLKNTEVLLHIKIKFGIDIISNKNIAFIRKKDS